jgi:predicted transcriptional regulator of viral defense system
LASGVYILPESYDRIDAIANMQYQPSYLSFESALSRYGLLSQVPYALTFTTTRKSVRKKLGDTVVEYRSLKVPLFFGYEKRGALFMASPEKALVDRLYMMVFGKFDLRPEHLDLKEIGARKALRIAKAYP